MNQNENAYPENIGRGEVSGNKILALRRRRSAEKHQNMSVTELGLELAEIMVT